MKLKLCTLVLLALGAVGTSNAVTNSMTNGQVKTANAQFFAQHSPAANYIATSAQNARAAAIAAQNVARAAAARQAAAVAAAKQNALAAQIRAQNLKLQRQGHY